MFKKYKHIHFVGIGGIGMSGIAQVLVTLGYKVTGSDLKKSSVTRDLTKRGAKIFIGHKAENINGAHLVVVSSAVNEANPEVKEARKLSIPIVPRAEMLAELMRLKYGIAVAGTHGKTTTTSLIATVLTKAGMDPTIIVGGKVNSFKTNARLGKGEFLVAEADESDRSFIKLSPTIAVITNIDPEHMENYRDFDHVRDTYLAFANKVPFYGTVVACSDHPEVAKLIPIMERRVVTYGFDSGDFMAKEVKQSEGKLTFKVEHKGTELGEIGLAVPGRHNVLNALASVAVATELDIPFAKIKKGLASFGGIDRRFQILHKNPMIVTDYAHHPREIEAVLKATKDGWPTREIVCVMQPHRYSRLSSLFEEFVNVLKPLNKLIILPVYSAGEVPIGDMSSKKLHESVTGSKYVETKEEMFDEVKNMISQDNIILFLGAGDVWKMGKEFAKNVKKLKI